ncbi:MAG: DUF6428 family protein [Bacteroidota bacterium]
MQTSSFLALLEEHPAKELIFEYRPGRYVPSSYHITEVKNLQIESVDCGGNEHWERQTVLQLWDGSGLDLTRAMSAAKARKIFSRVDHKRPLHGATDLFVEYGNTSHPTSVYRIAATELRGDQLLVRLEVPPTACKPKQMLSESIQAVKQCCGVSTSSTCC